MTDQDHDGSHIKGLLINFLDHFYPTLLKLPDFLVEFVTPIVRVSKGKQQRDFFTIPEYEQWLEDTPGAKKWDSKYFKGLGTSTDADARNYFSHMSKHMIPFAPTQDGDRELIDLAFSKKKADDRKEWLRQFKPGTYLDHRLEEIPYSEFINKELILFSMADNVRSIPSVADGLKPGQRKVIWGCFKRKLKKEIKVAQLVGYISEHAAYHHGEVSLAQTIVNLAQDYVGSNNISLLRPSGQYGTRDVGGKDHASPRYIFTEPMPLARVLMPPADDPLLKSQKDDNATIEPEWYMPILPLVLINGAEGIGTGWSTTIPCYNPMDIVRNIRRLMSGEDIVPMVPWWRGFKGEIKSAAKHKYDVFGVVRKINDTTVEITELPIHKWTQNYKAELEQMILGDKEKEREGSIKDYKEHHDNLNVHFIINMGAKELEKAEQQGLLEFFKLTSKINTSNMMCFDFDGKIRKYDSAEEILEEFYPMRLAFYQKRKDFLANEIQTAFEKLSNQARFVQMIINKDLVVSNRKKVDIVADLRRHKFRSFPKVTGAKASGEDEEAEEDEDNDVGDLADYDYLLGMAIWSLTKEKIERLLLQAQEKEVELLALLEKTPKDLWNSDLDRFVEEWEKDCLLFEEKKNTDANGKKVKRKQTTLKTRKSIGKGGSDDDDDFKPIKAAALKRKAPESKAVNSKQGNEDDDEKKIPIAKKKPATAAKKLVVNKDDEDSEPPAPKRKIAGPKKLLVNDDDEEEDDNLRSSTKKVVPKKTVKDESDSDAVEVIEKPTGKKKGPAKLSTNSGSDEPAKTKGKTATKRKSPAISDGESDEAATKPVKKKKTITTESGKAGPSNGKAAATQRKISKSMKPASPPKKSLKRVVESDSDSEIMDYDDLPKPPARAASGMRAARGVAKKYVEIVSDEEGSLFGDE